MKSKIWRLKFGHECIFGNRYRVSNVFGKVPSLNELYESIERPLQLADLDGTQQIVGSHLRLARVSAALREGRRALVLV